ncbi:MAG: hypothetical protein R3B95_21455 [Nitrospirales bacterium]|nr:hypothetical protein [Nitrospirales bacterium]
MKRIELGILQVFIIISLGGCYTSKEFHGLEPISPFITLGSFLKSGGALDTRQPTLVWKPSNEAGVKYDVIIYETLGLWNEDKGKRVYYKEGIPTANHRIEEPLEYDKKYCWTTRTRRESEIGEWSNFDYFFWSFPFNYGSGTNLYPCFRTSIKPRQISEQ